MLKEGLPDTLTYHNVDHMLDVCFHSLTIADQEGITDNPTLTNLTLAALYHDTGFLHIYQGHEEKSCEIARVQLPFFGVCDDQLVVICELIMATKVPQAPVTHLQKIICDADLDYLGRTDFYETGDKLRRELLACQLITGEHDWEELQLKFLKEHHFFTTTSDKKRTPTKLEYIKQLEQRQNSEKRSFL